MNLRILIRLVSWLIGVVLFVVISFELATRLYVRAMQAWLIDSQAPRGEILEVRLMGIQVFWICLIAGTLYASALARPSHFGGLPRVWRHLAITYLLFLIACVPLIRAEFIPLPDFPNEFELNLYLFFLLGLPVLCFVTGILAWIRLAFLGKPQRSSANSV